jgi:hypothetical protein
VIKATSHKRLQYEPGELIVKLKSTPQLQKSLEESLDTRIVERFEFGPRLESKGELARLKLPAHLTVEEGMRLVAEHPGVEYAEPNHRVYLDEACPGSESSDSPTTTDPDDLHYKLWGLDNRGQTRGKPGADISAKEAWQVTTGSNTGPIVAVIDTGIDETHPDLIDNLWINQGEIPGDGIDNDQNGIVDDIHGYNAYDDNNDLSDLKVHGTHVAGTVGAVGNNGQGITGVAQQAQLMTVKIFGRTGHTNQATVLRGLAYAEQMGARITTNSWGGIQSKAMEEAYSETSALHFASAGNSGRDNDQKPHFPGSYPIDNMVAVAATDHKDKLGSFSCYGKNSVDIGAPGQDIYSTLPRHRYKNFSGTSMATPHVAGAASLILTEYPDASNAEVKARLLESSDPLPSLQQTTVSGGRLNAFRALENDQVPPAAIDGFQARATAGKVSLSWSDTGDDGREGLARRVRLVTSDQPLTEANLSSARVLNSPAPQAAGTAHTKVLEFPLSKEPRTMHFGIVGVDNVGQTSPLVTQTASLPAAKVILADTQEAWTPEGKWSRVEDPDEGAVWTDSPDGDYEYGTEQYLTSDPISLKSTTNNVLRYRVKSDLARGDFLRLQVKTENGRWRNTDLVEGSQDWSGHEVSLARYEGQDIQLRFIFKTDDFSNADGVYLGRIELLGA